VSRLTVPAGDGVDRGGDLRAELALDVFQGEDGLLDDNV